MENYSVLMSVYHKEQPEFLLSSIESMFAQTVPTDDFVLVCDGPLTEELDRVIASLQQKYGSVLNVIRMETNRGLSYALNDGLNFCKNDLVARMDSDDISAPNRCELQLRAFSDDPLLTVVGGAITEFESTPANIVSRKIMPQSHEELLHYAKKRNPFNHPTVMFRKSTVLSVGSYPHIPLHEDYALWVNLFNAGAKGCNLQQTLCNMRVDNGQYKRRGGLKYFIIAVKFRYQLCQSGFCNLWDFVFVATALAVVCLVPEPIRKFVYLIALRKNSHLQK